MTKIAISPNVNGNGTFTIAAPNSNTDRTLTLPDAGGEVFSQGNIVGTVSESSGVPTGAIIESGSNANGNFVKYADGTMVCFHAITMDHTGEFSSSSRLSVTWTYPATFVGTIVTQMSVPVHVNANFSGCARSDITVFGPSGGNVSTAQAFSIFFDTGTVSTTAASVLNVQVSAHGRWY